MGTGPRGGQGPKKDGAGLRHDATAPHETVPAYGATVASAGSPSSDRPEPRAASQRTTEREGSLGSGVWGRHTAPTPASPRRGPGIEIASDPRVTPTAAPSPGGEDQVLDGAGDRTGAAVERQEHVASVLRWRRAFLMGTGTWVAFAAADWLIATLLYPGTLGYLLTARLSIMPVLLGIVWRIRRDPLVSPRALRIVDFLGFGAASLSITLMSLRLGGLESEYTLGIIVAIVARGAFVVEPWRKGVVGQGVIIVAWISVVLGAGLVDPAIAAQLQDPRAVSIFVVDAGFVVAVAALTILGNHAFWSLQRQVFASRSIGRYRLRRKLGEGGMGEVWAAWHGALKREVAVKLLRADATSDAAALRRFEREVAAMADLSHPNTIRVFDYGMTEDGLWYYVMELLDGEDVRRLVEREGPLPQARAVHIAEQAARALAEAHRRGIVHRDVKPENLFLTRAGAERDIVKVLDFGIAKRSAVGQDHTLTQTGAVIGTPTYMSPEAAAGEDADARSDLYSLGATLYFMLAGRPPFDSDNMVELLMAHLHSEVPPIALGRGAPVAPAVEAVVTRCLAKAPADRFPNAEALAAALRACVAVVDERPPLATQASPTADVPPQDDATAPTR